MAADWVERGARVVRLAGRRTGRIGVLVAPGGERSFVQDRGAALLLAPWAAGAALRGVSWTYAAGAPVSVAIAQGAVPQDEKWLDANRQLADPLPTAALTRHEPLERSSIQLGSECPNC